MIAWSNWAASAMSRRQCRQTSPRSVRRNGKHCGRCRAAQSLKCVVPASWPMGIWACRVRRGAALSEPVILNAPEPWWWNGDGGETASPGGWLRVFGKSLNFGGASQAVLRRRRTHAGADAVRGRRLRAAIHAARRTCRGGLRVVRPQRSRRRRGVAQRRHGRCPGVRGVEDATCSTSTISVRARRRRCWRR